VLTHVTQPARRLFARALVVVTDYSSAAFDAAYIERPVVYFQFDRDRVFRGEHHGRRGYFDYERDGFGPVTESCEQAQDAIITAVEKGPQPVPEYLARVERTFPVRNGRATRRVYRAIVRSQQRVAPTLTEPQTVERSRPSQ
jgi:CDP-glycerol glycerophosphotransferase (TagB/SpsB family)